MHKNHPRRIPSSVSRVMMMMKLLKIFVLLSSVVLFENLGAFGEVSAASTTGH